MNILRLACLCMLLATASARSQEDSAWASLRDPASSSLLLMPTGRTLPAGTGCLGLAAPYIPYGAYSVAEGVQISGGGVYIFRNVLGSGQAYYSYLFVKDAIFNDGTTSIAIGAAAMFWGQEHVHPAGTTWDRVVLPGVFAVTTIGDRDNALSLGVGFADIAGDFSIGLNAGLLAGIGLGYESRVSRACKLMTEHFFDASSGNSLHAFGARFFAARGAFDVGVIVLPNGEINLETKKKQTRVLPMLGISLLIG
jgi:hypothetical protein